MGCLYPVTPLVAASTGRRRNMASGAVLGALQWWPSGSTRLGGRPAQLTGW